MKLDELKLSQLDYPRADRLKRELLKAIHHALTYPTGPAAEAIWDCLDAAAGHRPEAE